MKRIAITLGLSVYLVVASFAADWVWKTPVHHPGVEGPLDTHVMDVAPSGDLFILSGMWLYICQKRGDSWNPPVKCNILPPSYSRIHGFVVVEQKGDSLRGIFLVYDGFVPSNDLYWATSSDGGKSWVIGDTLGPSWNLGRHPFHIDVASQNGHLYVFYYGPLILEDFPPYQNPKEFPPWWVRQTSDFTISDDDSFMILEHGDWDLDLFQVEKIGGSWGAPYNVTPPSSESLDFAPQLHGDRVVYVQNLRYEEYKIYTSDKSHVAVKPTSLGQIKALYK